MSKTGRRAGSAVGAVSRFSLLLLLVAVFAPALSAQGTDSCGYNPDRFTLHFYDSEGWALGDTGGGPDCTGYVTVPQGRKFTVLDRLEYTQFAEGCGYAPWSWCQPVTYTLTVTAPDGVQLAKIEMTRNDKDPLQDSDWILDGAPIFISCGWEHDCMYSFYYRRITTPIDVSKYTKAGSVQLAVHYVVTPWTMSGGISASFALYGASNLLLTQTPSTFQPRDYREGGANGESRSGPDIAQCGAHPGDCRPTFTATVAGMENRPNYGTMGNGLPDPLSTPPYTAIDFRLSLPKYQTAWLPGNSTNNGTDTDPDYVFCGLLDQPASEQFLAPDQNGLHINMPAPGPTNQVNVCSHDYGGVAILRATVSIGGTPWEAQIVGPNALSPPPPTCAGTGQFASLPVDQDCNGIADSWEAPYKNTPGYSADADLDGGPGQPGDGFSVRDEYRGFHYVTDDWDETTQDPTKIRWTRTDPTKKDVFFWDNDGTFTQALRAILAPTTQPIVYRRVSKAQANPKPPAPGQPVPGVYPLNKNSPTVTSTWGFALDFFNGPPPNGSATGDAQFLASEGQAIYLNNADFVSASGIIDPAVYRAAALAHEMGHVFGICHYSDLLQGQVPPPSPLSSLNLNQYALGSKPDPRWGTITQTYGRFNTYLSTVGVVSQDAFYRLGDLAGNDLLENSTDAPPISPPWPWPLSRLPGTENWVFNGTALGGWVSPTVIVQNEWLNPITPGSGIWVARQYGYIMDKYQRLFQPPGATDQPNLQFMQNWAWRPPSVQPPFKGDVALMCGPACHVPPAVCPQ